MGVVIGHAASVGIEPIRALFEHRFVEYFAADEPVAIHSGIANRMVLSSELDVVTSSYSRRQSVWPKHKVRARRELNLVNGYATAAELRDFIATIGEWPDIDGTGKL